MSPWPRSVWQSPWLRGIAMDARAAVEAAGSVRSLEKGARVFAVGDPADAFFVVGEGMVDVRAVRRGEPEARLLRRAVAGYDAWISSIRSDQSSHRAKASVVGWDAKFDLVKVNPLLGWTHRDVWAFVVANHVPYNPLHDQGYPSIGCFPCTRPVAPGGDERAGRWAGQAKTECGLHSLDSSQL